MNDDTQIIGERVFTSEPSGKNLMAASLFITAFEMLQDSIVGRVEAFFIEGFKSNEGGVNKKYTSDVLALDKSLLHASLQWLKQCKTIDDGDIEKLNMIKACRDKLVEDTPVFISADGKNDTLTLFVQMIEVLSKIEQWWRITVEIPSRPYFDDREIDKASIIPGKIMTLHLLAEMASVVSAEPELFHEHFVNKTRQHCTV